MKTLGGARQHLLMCKGSIVKQVRRVADMFCLHHKFYGPHNLTTTRDLDMIHTELVNQVVELPMAIAWLVSEGGILLQLGPYPVVF